MQHLYLHHRQYHALIHSVLQTLLLRLGGFLLCVFCGASGANGEENSFKKVNGSSIENLFVVGDRIISGGRPDGEKALQELSDMGVDTIINVDGSAGPAEEAKKLGIRTIHLPIGYDGISRETMAKLAVAMGVSRKKVFVHCHHGKHRGPAAVAILLAAEGGWKTEQCLEWMHEAGASPKYSGLYADVSAFKPLSPAELALVKPADLPEAAQVPARITQMARLDELFDHVRKSEEKQGPSLLLHEMLVEIKRNEMGDEAYLTLLSDAVLAAQELHELASSKTPADTRSTTPEPAAWQRGVARLEQSCSACHAVYRDKPHAHPGKLP